MHRFMIEFHHDSSTRVRKCIRLQNVHDVNKSLVVHVTALSKILEFGAIFINMIEAVVVLLMLLLTCKWLQMMIIVKVCTIKSFTMDNNNHMMIMRYVSMSSKCNIKKITNKNKKLSYYISILYMNHNIICLIVYALNKIKWLYNDEITSNRIKQIIFKLYRWCWQEYWWYMNHTRQPLV